MNPFIHHNFSEYKISMPFLMSRPSLLLTACSYSSSHSYLYSKYCPYYYSKCSSYCVMLGEITDETDAIPSVYPVRSGTSIGGMGILSMGRSSVMRKTPSSKAITIGEDKDAKLVKKTTNYANNSSTRKSTSKKKWNSSTANTNIATDTECNSRKNWQQRCELLDTHGSRLDNCATNTSHNRELNGILRRAGGVNIPYGTIPNDDMDDHVELNEKINTRDYHYRANIDSEKTTEETEDNETDNDMTKDAWTSGSEGYRITKNTSHLSFDDIAIEEQMTNLSVEK